MGAQTEVDVGGAVIALPDGWCELDAEDEEDDSPAVAPIEGSGALQFSVARYSGPPRPPANLGNTEAMLRERAQALGWTLRNVTTGLGQTVFWTSGDFDFEDATVRAWFASDGHHFAFVSFTCEAKDFALEVVAAERIVAGLRFVPLS